MAAGAEAFANSVASGVEGVVVRSDEPYCDVCLADVMQMKPIEGAENDGARGFFKGIGKGLVGSVKLHMDFCR